MDDDTGSQCRWCYPFSEKRQKKELCGYLMQLGIRTDEKQNVEKDADVEDVCGYILEEEWKNFAYTYLASCTGSRAYCSTLFGIVPIKDAAVAEKIAQDIDLVTKDYPAAFGLEEAVRPFRSIMVDAFCQYIPMGNQSGNRCMNKKCLNGHL